MTKAALESTIASLEAWGRTVDNWVLIFAAFVAVSLSVEVVFSVLHWMNENKLRPLRTELAVINSREIAELNNETARLKKQMSPRQIDSDAFLKELKEKPKAPVEIMYPREDTEAYRLSLQI